MGSTIPARPDEHTLDTEKIRAYLRGADLTLEQRRQAADVVRLFLAAYPDTPGGSFLRAAEWGLRQPDLTLAQVIDQADAWRGAGVAS